MTTTTGASRTFEDTWPCTECGVLLADCMPLDLHCCPGCRAEGTHDEPYVTSTPNGDSPQAVDRG